jgi:hypothetical protein
MKEQNIKQERKAEKHDTWKKRNSMPFEKPH